MVFIFLELIIVIDKYFDNGMTLEESVGSKTSGEGVDYSGIYNLEDNCHEDECYPHRKKEQNKRKVFWFNNMSITRLS